MSDSSTGIEGNVLHNTSTDNTTSRPVRNGITLISILVLLSSIFLAYSTFTTTTVEALTTRLRLPGPSLVSRAFSSSSSTSSAPVGTALTSPGRNLSTASMGKTPVYFLSHGGPNIMYDHDHPAYKKLQEIGREITQKIKPRAVVVVSGHWQAGLDTVQVNTAETTELIYDFYGFPSHYYAEKYPHVGSRDLSQRVLSYLREAGIQAEGVKRGLDHGVWAGFKCAFDPESNPLGVPIVQVSLFDSEDPAKHMRLGAAFSRLRDENVLVIGSGMAVHNLRDLRFTFSDPRPLPYTVSFDAALKTAVVDTAPAQREKAMIELLRRKDARQAHPSFDHLLPLHVAAGAGGEDKARRLFTFNEGSLGWAMFRFGELATEVSEEKVGMIVPE